MQTMALITAVLEQLGSNEIIYSDTKFSVT